MLRTIQTVAAILLVGNAAISHAASNQAATNKDIAIQAMVDIFTRKDPSAVDRYFSEPYKQHNMRVADGLEALRGIAKNMTQRPAVRTTIYRAIADKDLVALHSVYDGFTLADGKPMVAFDLFRFNSKGKIVEHWDALMPMGAPNAGGHTLVDGPGVVTDREKTEANRELVRKFVETIIIGEQFDRAEEFIDSTRYIQHNPRVEDGVEAFKAAFKRMASEGRKLKYTLHHLLAEGNFVFIQAEGGDKALVINDVFRVDNGKIVEHWDVLAPVPPREQWQNQNGPF